MIFTMLRQRETQPRKILHLKGFIKGKLLEINSVLALKYSLVCLSPAAETHKSPSIAHWHHFPKRKSDTNLPHVLVSRWLKQGPQGWGAWGAGVVSSQSRVSRFVNQRFNSKTTQFMFDFPPEFFHKDAWPLKSNCPSYYQRQLHSANSLSLSY